MTALTVAFDVLVAASIADAVTTRIGIARGRAVETNPLMHWSTRSMTRALLTKAIALACIGIGLLSLRQTAPAAALEVTTVGAAWTATLAWRNWSIARVPLPGPVVVPLSDVDYEAAVARLRAADAAETSGVVGCP